MRVWRIREMTHGAIRVILLARRSRLGALRRRWRRGQGSAASPAALLGLLAYEHAYVQAGQSVPLGLMEILHETSRT